MTDKNVSSLIARFLILFALALAADKVSAADPPLPPLVYIVATDPIAAEAGADTATMTVIRLGPTNAPLTVDYYIDGTAQNGVDYATLSGSVTIPAGAHTADIVVTPVDDTLVEGTETVVIALEQPFLWPPPYIVIWPGFAFATIEDNDPAPTNHPPRVALVNPPDGSVFVAPADITLVARASDSDGRVHHVEFFAGTRSLGSVTNYPRLFPRPIPLVAIADDGAVALTPDDLPDVTPDGSIPDPTILPGNLFRLLWEDVPAGAYELTAVATDNQGAQTRSAPVNIRVTEAPPQPEVNVVATDPVAAEGPLPTDPADAINTATFVVSRSGNTNIPLTVYYRLSGTASNGVDYQRLPLSVTIPAGERRAPVVVVPIDDNFVEGTETVVLTIAPPICIAIFPPPPDCYVVGSSDTARAVILDNDPQPTNHPPVVEIVRPLDGSVFLAPADIPIVAQARDADGRVVTVEFFEGARSLGIVTNNPGPTASSLPLFMLVWSNVPPGHYVLSAVATDNDGDKTQSRPVEIKVVERTLPPTVNIVATDPEASEQGGISPNDTKGAVNAATFTVSRLGPTTRSLLVRYSLDGTAENGVDYRRLSGEVTIPVGAASADIVVHPIDDQLVEGTETVVAILRPAICLATPDSLLPDCYVIGTNSKALAYIRDNDVAPTNLPPKVALIEPGNGDVFTAPADIRLVAEARDADGYVRSVEFFANDRSIGVVSNRLTSAGGLDPAITDSFFRLVWSNVLAGEYALTAKATDNRGAMTTSASIHIKVVFPQPPVVTILATDPYASERGWLIDPIDPPGAVDGAGIVPIPIPLNDPAVFTVRRSGGTNVDLVVHYSVGGTAENGVDYRKLSGDVTIPRGAWSADIVVDPIDDLLVEGTETVIIRLEPVACPDIFPPPPSCYVVGEPNRAIAYIRDNDLNQSPKVEIVSPTDGSIFRAGSNLEIDVLARDPDGYVTKVEFFAGTNRIGVDERIFIVAPPPGQEQKFSIVWSNVPAGEYKLTAKATDSSGAMTISDGVGIIVVPPTRLPVVAIEAVDKVATEQSPLVDAAPDTALFIVKRTGDTSRSLVVYYSVSGTASNGVDYERLPGRVEIAAGESAARIPITAIDDTLVEPTETVVLALEKPDCPAIDPTVPTPVPNGCYLVGEPGRDIAYIRDNDSPPNNEPHIAILVPDEGDTFAAPAEVEILAVGLDPDGWITQVQFFAGTNQIGGLAILVGNPPPQGQLQEFRFTWRNVPAGNYTLTAKATDNRGAMTVSAPVHIRVLETCRVPVVTITATDPVATEPRPNSLAPLDPAVFTVRRSCGFDRALLVHYRVSGTASNGVDYDRLGGDVLFQAGDSAARIIVNPLDDNLVEGTESVIVELVQPPCLASDSLGADCYLVGRPNRDIAFIRDNDSYPPRVAITSPANGAVFHAPANITLVAQALDPDGWVPQVEFFAGDKSLGVVTVAFLVEPPPGQLQTFELNWTNVPSGRYVLTAVATDNLGNTGRSEPVPITITNAPTVPTVTIAATDPYAREGSPLNTATFRIRRDCCTNSALTVWYSIGGTASNGVDYAKIDNSVTIPAGRRSAPITIAPVDDRRPEPIETIVLQLQQPPTGSPVLTYRIGEPDAAAAIIVDNDQPPPVSQRLADGRIHLCMAVSNGVCYRIEASVDLVNWEVVCRNPATGNTLQFVEPRGPDMPRRFYRVVPDLCEDED